MVKSNYVFESGEAIDVGAHGDTSYVFHSGDPVPNTGGSSFVFESGTALGGSVIIDDFERGDLGPYRDIDKGGWQIETGTVYEGSYAASATPDFTGDNTGMVSYPGDGLSTYPTRGDTWEQYAYPPATNDTSNNFGFIILAESGGPFYTLWLQTGANRFELQESQNSTVVGGTSAQIPTNEWVRVVIDTDTSDTIDCELYDGNDSLVASFSVVDATADGGGWGARNFDDNTNSFAVDFARKSNP